jgi:hypothetical protein
VLKQQLGFYFDRKTSVAYLPCQIYPLENGIILPSSANDLPILYTLLDPIDEPRPIFIEEEFVSSAYGSIKKVVCESQNTGLIFMHNCKSREGFIFKFNFKNQDNNVVDIKLLDSSLQASIPFSRGYMWVIWQGKDATEVFLSK